MADRPLYGFEEFIAIGQENSYGTKTGSQFQYRPVSFSVVNNDPPIQLAGPTGRPVGWLYDATLPREHKGVPDCSGDFTVESDWEDIGFLIKNALQVPEGDIGNAAYATNGSTWTFDAQATPDADGPGAVQSLSIHRETPGFADASGTPAVGELFRGCHINTFTLTGEPGQLVQCTCNVIGQDSTTEASDAAAGYSATPWMEYHETTLGISTTFDGSDPIGTGSLSNAPHAASSWTFEIENGLRAIGASGVGRRAIREPVNLGYRIFRLTVTKDWIDRDFYDHFLAEGTGGYANVSLKLTSDTDFPTSSPASPYTMTIHLPAARVVSPPPTYGGGPDILEEEVVFEAAFGATGNKICTITLQNGLGSTAYDDV